MPPTTVLLTAGDSALIDRLHRKLPAVEARVIGPDLPSRQFRGRLYCFVDWLLPELSGLEMCRRLRESPATRHGHITMVLDSADPEDCRRALRAGADDYLVGPLDAAKLAERLAVFNGSTLAPTSRDRLTLGDLSLDLAAQKMRYRGTAVPLSPNELGLLAHFMAYPDRVFGRPALIAALGKDVAGIDERTVDVWIGRLRRALVAHGVPDPLRTVRTMGYVLDSPAN